MCPITRRYTSADSSTPHKKYVAKKYIGTPDTEQLELMEVDCKLQMRTKYLARMYNQLEPPKKVR